MNNIQNNFTVEELSIILRDKNLEINDLQTKKNNLEIEKDIQNEIIKSLVSKLEERENNYNNLLEDKKVLELEIWKIKNSFVSFF